MSQHYYANGAKHDDRHKELNIDRVEGGSLNDIVSAFLRDDNVQDAEVVETCSTEAPKQGANKVVDAAQKCEVEAPEETCGKEFSFDTDLALPTSAKNRRYVLCKLMKKAFGELSVKEKRLMNYIMGLPEDSKTIETNLNKIKKDGEGHLSYTEKELHRKLNEKYGFESGIE